MKTKTKACLCAAVITLLSGCAVSVGPGPVVVATEPAVVVAPDFYVWDGYEYVGQRGGAYFFLNPGGVWVPCDDVVLGRFNVWVGVHPDWRASATRYDPHHPIEPRGGRVEYGQRETAHPDEMRQAAPAPRPEKAARPEKAKAAPGDKEHGY